MFRMHGSIMVQGTASSSGKSLVAAALCRILHADGVSVAPFKAQNMSNNSFVTRDGLEMGRAQVVQAAAAGLEPEVRMNPVLLKPGSDCGSQVVLEGKPAFSLDAANWHDVRERLREKVLANYESLRNDYDVIVLEGAGSPAEINLKKGDIVNMGMARMARSPVVIVGDIDRGGVFASLVGTMQLLDEDERRYVKGFIINKFRGNADLLKPGLDELIRITGIPVLGVIPWTEHVIDEEDGVSDRFEKRQSVAGEVDICVIRLPHISNYTDVLPLEGLPGVRVRWITRPEELGSPDLLILPGTKATIRDLATIRTAGLAEAVISYARAGGNLLGICGGFQMLGKIIADVYGVESSVKTVEGLGLLDMDTVFEKGKTTEQTAVTFRAGDGPFRQLDGLSATGYEIHMGQSTFGPDCKPFTVASERAIGVADATGRIAGTYLHGLFDDGTVAAAAINALRARKGLPELAGDVTDRQTALQQSLDGLAQTVRTAVDMEKIITIIKTGLTEATA